MSERGVGKPWTTYEDNLLIQAVAIHGGNDNWKAVAASVPGRTNKACRKRWLHSLSPNVKKSAWTPEEDRLLLTLYATHGTKWSVIARHIPGRTDDACSKRYREALDPSLKRDDWTADEDAKLLEAYSRLGGRWGLIGQELNRSGLGCRNRWRMLERRRAARERDGASRGDASSSIPAPSGTPSQWTPAHVQEQEMWDGRSPQYVTPSVLYQGSPLHSQESHGAAYSPEQILSGVHLNGLSTGSQDPPSFHYSSSSLSAALSHPNSVTQSPDPHGYYQTAGYSPDHVSSVMSDPSGSTPNARPRTNESHDYHFMPIGDDQNNTTPQSPQHEHVGGHTSTRSPAANGIAGPSIPGVDQVSAIPSDSPASPSQCGSASPPGSPFTPPGDQEEPNNCTNTGGDPADTPRSYYRTDAEKARMVLPPPRSAAQRPTRLSSNLPATSDATVLAYACGHSDCWPSGTLSSKNAFATSKELSDHSKVDHNSDLGGSKPFRCGLTGCEKSWKSINGLQYHLQISKYHFQQALATRTSSAALGVTHAAATHIPPTDTTPSTDREISNTEPGSAARTGDLDAVAEVSTAPMQEEPVAENVTSQKVKRKVHPCPRPGCGKEYKQLSGLRYHLTHGHMDTLPMQLDVVPPTLARMVAEKVSAPRP